MNRTIANLAIAGSVVGGVAVGASLVGTASAYGGDDASEIGADAPSDITTDVVQIQDEAPPDPPADGAPEGRDGRHRGGCNLEAVADALGLEVDALRAELDTGSSIADVAAANGVAVDVVVDAMLAEKEERLDAKVDAGDLTEAEADERLADAEERALDRINRVRGEEPANA